MVPRTQEGSTIAQAVKIAFTISNNEVEYEAVLLRLRVAKKLSITTLELQCDSQLVASQLQGEYKAKSERMEQYL